MREMKGDFKTKMKQTATVLWGSLLFGCLAQAWIPLEAAGGPSESGPYIRELSRHFSEPDGPTDPWVFIPATNVKLLSTAQHPGLIAIYEAGQGEDIKGVLERPIKIDDYPTPWQFQCSWMQNFSATTGRTPTQVNYAIGMNVALTFSDPASWPEDRAQSPPDTHSVQLFAVHLGNYGEVGLGLPQLKTPTHPSPETYLVYCRGDLVGDAPAAGDAETEFDYAQQRHSHAAAGDWQVPHIWIGDGARYGGPASNLLYFRAVIDSPTQISIGVKFDPSHGWNMRSIDVSRLGRITGIWEIGPIISGNRWIPDRLAPELGIKARPEVMLPDPAFDYLLDYCVFLGTNPMPFKHHGDEFNIPGYMGQWHPPHNPDKPNILQPTDLAGCQDVARIQIIDSGPPSTHQA